MNLIRAIWTLGFSLGFRYWKIERYYSKHPEELPRMIEACRQKAVLESDMADIWNSWANLCEFSYQNYLRRTKN
jgi:hypothetical protein